MTLLSTHLLDKLSAVSFDDPFIFEGFPLTELGALLSDGGLS
jgi:hypothetical protein